MSEERMPEVEGLKLRKTILHSILALQKLEPDERRYYMDQLESVCREIIKKGGSL